MTQREQLLIEKQLKIREYIHISRRLETDLCMPRKQYTASRRRLLVLDKTLDNIDIALAMAL